MIRARTRAAAARIGLSASDVYATAGARVAPAQVQLRSVLAIAQALSDLYTEFAYQFKRLDFASLTRDQALLYLVGFKEDLP